MCYTPNYYSDKVREQLYTTVREKETCTNGAPCKFSYWTASFWDEHAVEEHATWRLGRV